MAGLALILGACGQAAREAPPPDYQEPPAESVVAPEAPQETEFDPIPEALPAITGVEPEGTVTVGILLPLSGRNAGIGQALLNAAQLALFDLADDDFKMIVGDTGGTPEGARAATRDLLDRGAGLILGPLFSTAVGPVAEEAALRGVSVLAFSNNVSVARPGVYLIGVLPEIQVERIISFAQSTGLQRIAALVPATDYGNVVTRSFRETAFRTGGEAVDIRYFEPLGENMELAARELADYDRRHSELLAERSRLKAQDDDASRRALKRLEVVDTLEPPEFDAVFLPLGGRELLTAAPLLAFYDVDPADVRYLGTALWYDEGLALEPTLQGGWFAAPQPDLWESFLGRYRESFGEEPPRLASLAYDATALAAVLARQAEGLPPGDVFGYDRLTNPNGFAGVDGIFRLLPDGRVQRALAVLEINRDGLVVVDPAPTTFEAVVF